MNTHATIEDCRVCNGEELLGNGVFFGADLRIYNEDPRPAEIELRESLGAAVEDD
jgi:hypothetical protein